MRALFKRRLEKYRTEYYNYNKTNMICTWIYKKNVRPTVPIDVVWMVLEAPAVKVTG